MKRNVSDSDQYDRYGNQQNTLKAHPPVFAGTTTGRKKKYSLESPPACQGVLSSMTYHDGHLTRFEHQSDRFLARDCGAKSTGSTELTIDAAPPGWLSPSLLAQESYGRGKQMEKGTKSSRDLDRKQDRCHRSTPNIGEQLPAEPRSYQPTSDHKSLKQQKSEPSQQHHSRINQMPLPATPNLYVLEPVQACTDKDSLAEDERLRSRKFAVSFKKTGQVVRKRGVSETAASACTATERNCDFASSYDATSCRRIQQQEPCIRRSLQSESDGNIHRLQVAESPSRIKSWSELLPSTTDHFLKSVEFNKSMAKSRSTSHSPANLTYIEYLDEEQLDRGDKGYELITPTNKYEGISPVCDFNRENSHTYEQLDDMEDDSSEHEDRYWKLEHVSVISQSSSVDYLSDSDSDGCQEKWKALKDKCAAKEAKLRELMKENDELKKRNEVLRDDTNIDKGILETIVRLRIENGTLKETMESQRRMHAHMEAELKQLRGQKKNKAISVLQEKLTQSEEQCKRLQSMVNEDKKNGGNLDSSNHLEMPEIKDIEIVKQKIGKGSYGSVSLIRVDGIPCIQKSLHSILIGDGVGEEIDDEQKTAMKGKFYMECKMLWKIQHPNVVQFMGVHYYGGREDKHLSLIMEFLPTSLEDFLKRCNSETFKIPLSIKLSIIRDVSYGLTQLHLNKIIHRDLSASNILLTSSLRAKIADFGVSKLVRPGTLTKLSIAPGAMYIMPPEALEQDTSYSTKMDIFSFGIVSLYLILQKLPLPTNASLTSFHLEKKQIAIGKRMSYLRELGSINLSLENVVFNCLQDVPERRPTIHKVTKDILHCISNNHSERHRDMIAVLETQAGRRLLMSPEELFA